jgi:8-oxo-dGTP pyrophosphatase MutT (NUDIX family)
MTSGDEWWDVVDAEGSPTGDTYRRGAADWPSGRFHLIVAVCVQREDGAILLTQRAANKEFPFRWEFPGGSALAGETSRQAASRELREETSIDVPPSALTPIDRFVEASALLDFYTARVPVIAELSLQQSEVMAAEWVTPEEVVRRLGVGLMADPWAARLDFLWPPTTHTLNAVR